MFLSSFLDDNLEEIEKEKELIIKQLQEIETQFNLISEAKRKEKLYLLDCKQKQILDETSPDYQQPLAELVATREARLEVAETVRKFRLQALEVDVSAEKLAASQNYKVCFLFQKLSPTIIVFYRMKLNCSKIQSKRI